MRGSFGVDGIRLSYLDFGGPGIPLLAFHGHFNEAAAFAPLAEALAPRWRVIALDQRGARGAGRAPGYRAGPASPAVPGGTGGTTPPPTSRRSTGTWAPVRWRSRATRSVA